MNSPIRIDSHAKLTGQTKYIDDYREPDMLEGAIFFSPVDAGKITKIIFPTEFDPASFTIVLAGDIPGENRVPEPVSDQLFLAEQHIGHKGQPILGVAHPSREVVRAFVAGIRIEVDAFDTVTETKKALDNPDYAFGREIVIDHGAHRHVNPRWMHTHAVYYTPHQEQAYLEPQGMLARHDEASRTMHVRGTMQCPYFVKSAVEAILGDRIAEAVVQVSEGIGGAFGGKERLPQRHRRDHSAARLEIGKAGQDDPRPQRRYPGNHQAAPVACGNRFLDRSRRCLHQKAYHRLPPGRRILPDRLARGAGSRRAARRRMLPLRRRLHPGQADAQQHPAQRRFPWFRSAPGDLRHRIPRRRPGAQAGYGTARIPSPQPPENRRYLPYDAGGLRGSHLRRAGKGRRNLRL